jgi:preprotein translocase subunit SecA
MERQIVLQTIDTHWQEYLRSMDALRQGVGLRAYGQRDPLIEYKREAFDMFEELMDTVKQEIATSVFRASTSVESFESFLAELPQTLVHDDVSLLSGGYGAAASVPSAGPGKGSAFPTAELPQTRGPSSAGAGVAVRRETAKVGRNDPCPCGSGRKYKKCHGA